LIDRMATLKPLFGIPSDSLHKVRDPLELQKVLNAASLNFPKTKPCDGLSPGVGQWLHKTGQGGNGSGVSRHQSEPPGLPRRDGYWQQRIDGTPGSALFIDDKLQGITQQLIAEPWTRAGAFQYCGTLAPWNSPSLATADIARLGKVLMTQFDLHGLFGVDFIFDGEQVWPLEVNPRVTAAVEIVDRVAGTNLLTKHLAAFGLAVDRSQQEAVPASGKAILYAKHPLAVSGSLSESLLARTGFRDSPQLADIPNPATQISVGEPILSVLADGTSSDAVEAELRERVAELEHELYRD
jgi:predicted ATP-grasp superfamily ATP-dependent carboligase